MTIQEDGGQCTALHAGTQCSHAVGLRFAHPTYLDLGFDQKPTRSL